MCFELKFNENKKVFTLSQGQYEYTNTVNDEIISIAGLNILPFRRRIYFDKGKKYNKECVLDLLEWLPTQLPCVGKIINSEYECFGMDKCYDDLYNLFLLILSDVSQLSKLALKQSECENRYDLPRLETIPTFDVNIRVSYAHFETKYSFIINSVAEYINVLFCKFVSNNPVVSICQNCDKLFVPKTKKVTLYCDRVTDENLTCKKIGAKNKYYDKLECDPVLKKYYLEKHRIQMYCLRDKQDKYDFFNEYFEWLNNFEPKIVKYKNGKYSGDLLINEINNANPNYQPYSKGLDYSY